LTAAPLACLALPASAQDNPRADASDLRVMSFNIRYGSADDGPNRWDQRKPVVLQAIERFNPDLLGTQETLDFQADYLRQQLPEYACVGRTRQRDGPEGEQCALFFRRTRFEQLAAGHFWLSETPDVPGSKSWDSSLPRMATWVLLEDRRAGSRPVCFFNTHFDHRGAQAREESARLIVRRIEALSRAFHDPWVVLTGDFNTTEELAPYQVFAPGTEGRLVDTYRAVYPERAPGEATFGGWRGIERGARIDWILVDPRFQVQAASIDRTSEKGRYPSDHYPVTAVLRYAAVP
jgi:endonuclease/exonuclease/phosphatase family metal-dependent hydrolase